MVSTTLIHVITWITTMLWVNQQGQLSLPSLQGQ